MPLKPITESLKTLYSILWGGLMTNKETSLKEFIANRIRFLRKEQGLSQEALSELAGMEAKYINKIENMNVNIKMETLEKIMNALSITYTNFFDFKFQGFDNNTILLLSYLERLSIQDRKDVIQAISVLLSKM